jgi:hypothetical protein
VCGRAIVIQHKTRPRGQFEITEQAPASIRDWLASSALRDELHRFSSRFHHQPHIKTGQMPALSTTGSNAPVSTARLMRPLDAADKDGAEPQGGAAVSRAHQARKVRRVILASKSMTRSLSPSKSSSDQTTGWLCSWAAVAPKPDLKQRCTDDAAAPVPERGSRAGFRREPRDIADLGLGRNVVGEVPIAGGRQTT